MTGTGRSISFVLPMFNESENIAETVDKISRLGRALAADYEIVIVDDASTDKGPDIVEGLARNDHHIKPIRLKSNTRFGGALKTGLKRASKEIVIYTDADLPAGEDDIKKALELLNGADIVTARSLAIKDSSVKRVVMSMVYNLLVRILFGLKIKDINSGLKIYKRHVLDGMELESDSPFVDVEIFAEAVKKNCVIKEYGLVFQPRAKGSSTISRMGVVAATFRDMLRYRFFR